MRHGIFFRRHMVYCHFPYFYVPDCRVGVDKLTAAVMPHQDVECFAFFVHVFEEVHTPPADNAFGFHAVAACHLGVLKYQFVVHAECDADVVVPFQHVYAASRRAGMQVDDSVLIAEVHRYYVRISFQVGDADITNIAPGNYLFHPLLIFNGDCFHGSFF